MAIKPLEIWERTVEKIFRDETAGTHLEGMRDKSSDVKMVDQDAAVINFTALGGDPELLINNTNYPIAVSVSADDTVIITLKKLETTNTAITDDELKGLTYDKIKEKTDTHIETLTYGAFALANFMFAPQTSTAKTPIILTTGGGRAGGSRKMLTISDVIDMKASADKNKWSKKGRRLVLCDDHFNDLLRSDENFEKQYKDIREGQVLRLHGFDIYQESDMPTYSGTGQTAAGSVAAAIATMAKDAFGSNNVGKRNASFAYVVKNAMKASTNVKIYKSASETDPTMRRTLIGTRKFYVASPIKQEGFAAIVDND